MWNIGYIFSRLFMKSKLVAMLIGLIVFGIGWLIFKDAGIGVVISTFFGAGFGLYSQFVSELKIKDQSFRPSLFFAMVLPPVIVFLITTI